MGQKFLDYTGLVRVIEHVKSRFSSYVPMSRMVNNHDLSDNIDLTAHDVSALNEDDLYDLIETYILENARELI